MTTTPDTTPVPEALVAYLRQREIQRAEDVAELLTRFSERELLLMKEAAVMGYVQGVRHGPYRDKIPGDRAILLEVAEACLSFRDLYPTITGYQPEAEEADADGTAAGGETR
jgi:hypothetical protein